MTKLTKYLRRPRRNSALNLSPLEVPELLELILSHFTTHALRSSALLVCRQWFRIASGILLASPVTWYEYPRNGQMTHQELLQGLQYSRSLIIQHRTFYDSSARQEPKLWDKLLERLDTLSKEGPFKIRELSIMVPLPYDLYLFPLVTTMAQSLTSLRLENMGCNWDIPLERILNLCPRLLVLHADYTRSFFYRHIILQGRHVVQPRPALPARLKLRHLSLERIAMDEEDFFRLLRSCQDLEQLRVIRLSEPLDLDKARYPIGHRLDTVLSMVELSVLEKVAEFCPRLKSVDISFFTHNGGPPMGSITTEDWIQRFALFPKVAQWSFHTLDISKSIFEAITKSHPTNLTSLEICNWGGSDVLTGFLLHKYLCGSPHLLHIKAPRLLVDTAWFDLEGILDSRGNYYSEHYPDLNDRNKYQFIRKSIQPFHRKIWACRHLRTLHLSFKLSSRYDDVVEAERLMFGYLVRVCPRLQDLQITHSKFSIALKSGFCLLTRLHELRRLKLLVDRQVLRVSLNADWIRKHMTPGQCIKMLVRMKRYERKEDVKCMYARTPFLPTRLLPLPCLEQLRKPRGTGTGWAGLDLIDDEDRYDGIRRSDETECSKENALETGLDGIIDGVDMRKLGKWEDLIQLFKERMLENWSCWPRLESFEISQDMPLLRRVGRFQETVKQLRPEFEVL